MVYKGMSSKFYPFRRENAKFFSEDLIEYILFEYGHSWKPNHSPREERLRAVAGYVFTANIGRLVLFVSQTYGDFVLMKCFNNWKFIMSQRPSVRGRSLGNEIVRLCGASDLNEEDLGLFSFMAVMAEYARLAISSSQEELIEVIVDNLAYCLTNRIPGGYIATLDRMKRIADSFEYPRSTREHDPDRQFLSPVSTLSYRAPESTIESPLSFAQDVSSHNQCGATAEEIEAEFKKRVFRREYFRRKSMIDCATQTEISRDYVDCHFQSAAIKTDIVDRMVKINIGTDETLEDLIKNGELIIVERCDVYVQTGSIKEVKSVCRSLVSDVSFDNSAPDRNVCRKGPVDFNIVAERLVDIKNSQTGETVRPKETSSQKTGNKVDTSEDLTKGNSERVETCQIPMVITETISEANTAENLCQSETVEQEHSETAYLDCQLQSIKFKLDSSKTDEGINVSFADSQSESFDESLCTVKEGTTDFEQDESFDSHIESLDASLCKSSDESRLEN